MNRKKVKITINCWKKTKKRTNKLKKTKLRYPQQDVVQNLGVYQLSRVVWNTIFQTFSCFWLKNQQKMSKINQKGWKQPKKGFQPAFGCAQHLLHKKISCGWHNLFIFPNTSLHQYIAVLLKNLCGNIGIFATRVTLWLCLIM